MGDHRTARRAAAVLNIGAPTTVAFAVAFTGAHTYANAGQNRKPAGRAELAEQLVRERAQAAELVRENRRLRRDLRVRWRPTVQHAIALASATYRVDRHLLDRISYCESTYRPTARNGRYVGIAQFGLPLWNSTAYWAFDRTDPYASALGLAEKIREGGLSHWYASRHCWGGAR